MVVLIHAGILLLLISEAATAMLLEEGVMTIREGQSSHFAEDRSLVELVIVDVSDPAEDIVYAVPQSMVERQDRLITHPALPFAIRICRWLPDSVVHELSKAGGEPHRDNPATVGAGLLYRALPSSRPIHAANTSGNTPSLYVTIEQEGQVLDTCLVSLYFTSYEQMVIDGKPYRLSLRPRRIPKQYTMHLLEFNKEVHGGTNRPKSFASRLRLVDPLQNEDREIMITMNRPFRYMGDTFYQYSYTSDEKGTQLLVVRNPVKILPYISSIVICTAMFMYFISSAAVMNRRAAR